MARHPRPIGYGALQESCIFRSIQVAVIQVASIQVALDKLSIRLSCCSAAINIALQHRCQMSGLRKALAHLQSLRAKFEGLLAAARRRSSQAKPAAAHVTTRLRQLPAFGSNPGNLRMFIYAPDPLPSMPPLVVALHGCSQSAAAYDHGTGWSTLADRLGFVVVYPEQQPANNPNTCFSWFQPGDIARDDGEVLSIQQMVEHAKATFGVDRRKVFVSGLSAGGAMASAMLATYPEVYAGGAMIAGLPYGCAGSVQEAFEAMFTEQSPSARSLGDRVRAASRHQGPWPKISVWHGSADPIVKPSNGEHIVRQWINVHGVATAHTHEDMIGGHARRVWNDANGTTLIEAFAISGMAHGVPLAPSMDADGCGATGPFFLDAGISSTHHIARFWGLGEGLVEMRGVAAGLVAKSDRSRAGTREIEVAARTGSGSNEPAEAPVESVTKQDVRPFHDPNHVIAAAFKAAGLPLPEPLTGSHLTPLQVDPGPIIEAALKAAGLRR